MEDAAGRAWLRRITQGLDTGLNLRMNRNMRNWWRRVIDHLSTLLLSVILGLIVWLIAIDQKNPLLTQEYTEPVPVEVRGLPDNLELTRDPERQLTQLVLQAPQTFWDSLQPGDVTAYVDLQGLRQGEHEVPIQVKVTDPDVVVKLREPARVSVQIDNVVTKTVSVRPSIMDNTAFGYDWKEPVVRPISVTVRGPASQVNLVTVADAPIYLRGANSQVERFETVKLVDNLNQRVTQVEAIPDIVEVVVPVERWPGRKEVAVRVDLEGQPANGFRLGQIKVEPSVVVLRGNSDVLSTIGFVETQPLSIEGTTNDLRRRLELILPSGVTAFEGDMVDVLVGVVPVEDSDRITIKPTPRGLSPGLKATIALDTVDVIVIGPQSILEGIGSDDIFVFLDLYGLLAGTHVIQPNVVKPPGVRIEGVLPATVEVMITAVPTPTASPMPISPLRTPEAILTEP